MASILNRKIQTTGLQQAATIIILLCCFTFALVPPKPVVISSTYSGIRKLMRININGGDSNLSSSSNNSSDIEINKDMELMLGSTPPRCVNSCRSCRPCNAVLVVPPNLKRKVSSVIRHFRGGKRLTSAPSTSFLPATMVVTSTQRQEEEEEESYYLLSWKCRCKNTLFQP